MPLANRGVELNSAHLISHTQDVPNQKTRAMDPYCVAASEQGCCSLVDRLRINQTNSVPRPALRFSKLVGPDI